MKHRPRKRFGQNFLCSQAVLNEIGNYLNIEPTDLLLEIGAGQGALTNILVQKTNKVIAIEIDKDLSAHLLKLFREPQEKSILNEMPLNNENNDGRQNSKEFNLLAADALDVDYSQWGRNLRVVGNLPYNIATPLLIKLLSYIDYIKDLHLMFQQEVALRLAAKPGNKNYGRLSILTQYHCLVEPLIVVPSTAFFPVPKVNSIFLRLLPHKISPYPRVNLQALTDLTRQAFSMRRKTLANNLAKLIPVGEINNLGINPKARPEQISIKEYVLLANYLAEKL